MDNNNDKNILDKLKKIIIDQKSEIFSLRHIIDELPGDVYWKDSKGVYLGMNRHGRKSLRRMGFAWRKSDIVGKTDYDLFDKESADKFSENDSRVIKKRIAETTEESTFLPSGKKITQLSTKRPLFDEEGLAIGIIGNTVDITKLKELQEKLKIFKEKAEASSTAKSEFIANISHDLRTPMTGVSSMLDGIAAIAQTAQSQLQSPTPDMQHKLKKVFNQLKKIQQCAEAGYQSSDILMQLLNEVLNTMQLQSGKVVVDSAAFDVHAVIQRQRDLLRPVAEEKQLQLSLTLDDSVPRYLLGLRQYVERILLNLMSNALKFTDKGFVSLMVTVVDPVGAAYKKGDTIQLKIEVEDSGIGIPNDKFTEIFEHFSRLTPSYKGRYQGYGLGLCAVKHYVDLMNGHIEVASEVGKGSCFTVMLAFTVDDHADPIIETAPQSVLPAAAINEPKRLGRAHILLVEDSPTAALGTVMLLERLGCSVDVTETGAGAMERAANQTYDLIFMDVGLPDISGIEVTQKIRALADAQQSQVPIVALTGHATDPDIQQQCLVAGMNAVLAKPAKKRDLEAVLQQRTTQTRCKPISTATVESTAEPWAVIDWEGSLEMYAGDEKATDDMLAMLVNDLKKTQTVLANAYDNRDIKALRAELHHCLSGVVYVKLPQLEQAIRTCHQAVKSSAHTEQQLQSTYLALQQAIQAFFEQYKKNCLMV